MRRMTNSIRLTKEGLKRIDDLLVSFLVNDYHKTLLRGIKDRATEKNLSKSDCDIFEVISKQYAEVLR